MKLVYLFSESEDDKMNNSFGRRGTYIAQAAHLGLPVMEGLIITSDACNQFYKDDRKINDDISKQLNEYISKLEKSTGKKFGNIDNPLLISIKCSPKSSIPNIMDSILNIGLTDNIVENVSKKTNEYVWIWECYLNLIKDYAKTVMGIELECFNYVQDILNNNSQLTIDQLKMLSHKLKEEYKIKTQSEFPDNSQEQLYSIITTAYKSYDNKRANFYRKDLDIPFEEGMAICIQQMSFGNMNQNSGTGTIFTRNPITGKTIQEYTDKKYFVGNFSKQSIKTTCDANQNFINEDSIFSKEFPDIYNQLTNIAKTLERYYKDMLKIDFVIENNKLFITEIGIGKRTARAALEIACSIAEEYGLDEKANMIKVTEKSDSFEYICFGAKPIQLLDDKKEPSIQKRKIYSKEDFY